MDYNEYPSSNGSTETCESYLHSRVKDHQSSPGQPGPLDIFREGLRELALAPLKYHQEFGDDGGKQQPRVLAHAHGAPAERMASAYASRQARSGNAPRLIDILVEFANSGQAPYEYRRQLFGGLSTPLTIAPRDEDLLS